MQEMSLFSRNLWLVSDCKISDIKNGRMHFLDEVGLYLTVACDWSDKQFTLVIYESRVVIWGRFKSGTTLES